MRSVWLGLVIVAGCGDNVPDPRVAVGGTRLSVVWMQDADGAREFRGFHDRERDERCDMYLQPGQSSARCLPPSAGTSSFRGADCKEPVLVIAGMPSELPNYISTYSAECGGGVDRMFERGGLRAPFQIYELGVDGCVAVPLSPNQMIYKVGPEIPLDAFVVANVVVASGGPRLQDRYLLGEDGSRLGLDPFDRELGVTCSIADVYGQRGCHPRSVPGGWLWTDATCSTPLLDTARDGSPCEEPASPYGALLSRGPTGKPYQCWSRSVVRFGPQVTPTELYSGIGTCGPEVVDPDRSYFEVGDPVTVDEFAPVDDVIAGSGRIREHFVVADGLRGPATRLVDTERDVNCDLRPMRDGTTRCVPTAAGVESSYFDDPQCQRRPTVAVLDASCDGVFELNSATVESRPAFGDVPAYVEVHELGTEIMPGALYELDALRTCVSAFWDRAQRRRFALGVEIVPSQLVPFVETIY